VLDHELGCKRIRLREVLAVVILTPMDLRYYIFEYLKDLKNVWRYIFQFLEYLIRIADRAEAG
jgi:hypothetical protein